MTRALRPAGFPFLVLAIALVAAAFLPGLASATPPELSVLHETRLRADSLGAVSDSSAAAADSSAAAPAGASGASTAADSVRANRKEFPRPDSTLVTRLRSGGYVIVFRHSITDWAQRDADGENFEDRSVQRNLSKEGEAQAARIGKAIAGLQLPIGTVLSSPMWRCRDTAQIAFGRHRPVRELFRRGPEYRAMRLALLGTEPKEGKDLVLVTHQDVLIPIVKGLRRDQLKEGDALVVKPLGEGAFQVVAQVTPEDWERLAADNKAATVAKNGKALKSTKSKKTAKN